jgi:hypothetical protein
MRCSAGIGALKFRESAAEASLVSRTIAALTVVFALALPAAASAQDGTITADSGFRPNPNGFSFENYTKEYPNLSAAEMRKLFGDGVCVGSNANPCTLTPEAQAWMDKENKGMDGGHCNGFSIAALLLRQSNPAPSAFGGDTTFGLAIPGNVALARFIAYGFVFQTLDSVKSKKVNESPQAVIDRLREAFQAGATETYTLGFYKPGFKDGHAVTPYALRDDGNGVVSILLYDNNYPNTERALKVDTKTQKWEYNSATNPNEKPDLYTGGASDNRLEVEPTSPGLGVQPCPFCSSGGGGGRVQVSDQPKSDAGLRDQETMTVSDARGREAGVTPEGKLTEKLPGSEVTPLTTGAPDAELDNPVADVSLSPGRAYTIDAEGTSRSAGHDRVISAIGPGWVAEVSGLAGGPGSDEVRVSADGNGVTITPGRGGHVAPLLTLSDGNVIATVRFGTVEEGAELSADLDVKHGELNVGAPNGARVTIEDVAGKKLADEKLDGDGTVSFRGGHDEDASDPDTQGPGEEPGTHAPGGGEEPGQPGEQPGEQPGAEPTP